MNSIALLFSSLAVWLGFIAAVDNPLEDLKDAIVFNAKTFHYDVKYNKNLTDAMERERQSLKPGERKQYGIYVEYIAGEEDWPVFKFLHPEGIDLLASKGTKLHGHVWVSKDRFVVTTPTVPPTRKSFEETMAGVGEPGLRLTYEDLAFAFEAGNRMSGFAQSFDFDSVEVGRFQFAPSELVDLADPRVYAPADGTIILLAKESEETYAVFGPESKKPENYQKQEGLKAGGNTVYMLVKWQGGEYTVAYRRLKELTVKLGDEVKTGAQIGEFPPSAERSRPPIVEIWRVPKPEYRWLKGRSDKDGPYIIYATGE